MRRAVFVTHVPHEGPGLIGEIAVELGFCVETVEAHRGDPLPADLGGGDLLVVMGGPMGVGDLDDPRFPWLKPTAQLLKERLIRDEPSLGICLGCQLLAHAAGAAVRPMRDDQGERVREIGWLPVRLHPVEDALTVGLPAVATVLHWHGDGCGLPPGAVWLASTEVCPVQMFRLGRSVGIQFHPEVDAATACQWADEDAAFVRAAYGPQGVEKVKGSCAAVLGETDAFRRELLRRVFALADPSSGP